LQQAEHEKPDATEQSPNVRSVGSWQSPATTAARQTAAGEEIPG